MIERPPRPPRPPRRRLLVAAACGIAPFSLRAQTEPGVEIGGGRIALRFEDDVPAALHGAVQRWVQVAARAVAGYLGRFPVARLELHVRGVDGAGVMGGTTFADPEPTVRVRLGRATRAAQFDADWVLVHEMIHLAVPRVPRSQTWLHEGLATYVEGAARVRAGLNTAPRLWAEWVRGLPQGQPQADDRGLDHTPTWGRRYWGGALFCLVADVTLLRRSDARRGLRHALQGVLAAGGNYAVAWPAHDILAVADAAVGQQTLVPLYESMKASAVPVDLAQLWRDLGVDAGVGGGAGPGVDAAGGALAELSDDAPLAAVRRAITG